MCSEGCCADPSNKNVKLKTAQQIFGVLLLIISIIEFGLGGYIRNFLSNVPVVGAWWAVIATV